MEFKYIQSNELQEIGHVISFTRDQIDKRLYKRIRSEVDPELGTWALCAKCDDKHIVLQVASSGNIQSEIIRDLKCMLPSSKADEKPWNSYYFKGLFKVTYGKDARCQKYNHIYNSYSEFFIVIVDYSKFLKNDDVQNYSLAEYAEAKMACRYRAVYWWPNNTNKEREIISKHPEWNDI